MPVGAAVGDDVGAAVAAAIAIAGGACVGVALGFGVAYTRCRGVAFGYDDGAAKASQAAAKTVEGHLGLTNQWHKHSNGNISR